MDFTKLYINGEWVESDSKDFIEVENPATQAVFAKVPAGNGADVDKAVRAAAAAFPQWSATPLPERKVLMEKFLALLESQKEQLIAITVKELGSPYAFAKAVQVEYQYTRIRSYIDLADQVPMVEKMEASTVYREPVGVVGCITPWNNVLSEHPLVNMISFTGSTAGGITVSRHALGSVKRISLELGGKSPFVLLPGCKEYTEAIRLCFNSIFLNSGQTCTAYSRLLVPQAEKAAVEKMLVKIAAEYTMGDPLAENVKLGPLASAAQFKKVKGFIEQGLAEGAKLLYGGVPEEGKGYYIRPTIFTEVDNRTMAIAREEIFGPVLCVIVYKGIEEAVAIANDTAYGLNACVYGAKEEAIAVAHRIQAGNVYINASPRDCAAPFGGYKQSGIGREGGVYGMLEFTQQKALFDTGK